MQLRPRRQRAVVSYVEGDDRDDEDDEAGKPVKKARRGVIRKRAPVQYKEQGLKFLELPGEIRNMIYRYLLCQPGGVLYIGSAWNNRAAYRKAVYAPVLTYDRRWTETRDNFALRLHRQHLRETSTNFNILRVCKEVSNEALGVLYSQKFHFNGFDSLQHFLLDIPTANIARLRHVVFPHDINAYSSRLAPVTFSLLRPATNLQVLRIDHMYRLHRRFNSKIGPVRPSDNMTVEQWDALVGCNMAREAYAFMYPYLRAVVPEMGAENISRVLHIFTEAFDKGPRPWEHVPRDNLVPPGPQVMQIRFLLYHGFRARVPNNEIYRAEWTDERRETMRAAMGQEIARLVAEAQ